MHSMKSSVACFFLAVMFIASTVQANMGTDYSIHSAIQNGQDVEITIAIFLFSPPPYGIELTRKRDTEEGRYTVVFDEEGLNENDADEIIGPYCSNPTESDVDCDENPDICLDCDDDGTIECYYGYGECIYEHRIVILDECVPPDTWRYNITFWDGWGEDTKLIEVLDSGDSCLGSGADEVGGDEGGEDEGGEDEGGEDEVGGDEGCSVISVQGKPTFSSLFALLMLSFGLFFFFYSGKRREK